MGSRKPSTKASYLAKRKRFSDWALNHGLPPLRASIQSILDYLLYLKQKGLAISSIKVHLAAISAFHPPIQGSSVFSHYMMGRFLKGLERLFPQVHNPLPPGNGIWCWHSLWAPPSSPSNLLLIAPFMESSFPSSYHLDTQSELWALTSEPPYTVFCKDKVQLQLHLPKVVSQFHNNQDTFMLMFYPKPHRSAE